MGEWLALVGVLITAVAGLVANGWKHKSNLAALEASREQIKKESESDIVPQLTDQLKQVFLVHTENQIGRISKLETKLDKGESQNLDLIKQVTRLEVRIEGLEKKLISLNRENTSLRGKVKDLKFENAELRKRVKWCEGCEKNG